MRAPYLNQVRITGELGNRLKSIIYDVSEEFDVQGNTKHRPVPHITLFGPYNTSEGYEAKTRVQELYSDFDVVPFRISGFDAFGHNDVVCANVIPSKELRALRRQISSKLRPISYNYPEHDLDYWYDFHVTIAFKDVGSRQESILEYLQDNYELQVDSYAKRITSLRGRDMMWEWELPQGKELRPDEATQSLETTDRALRELKSPDDHADLAPKPGPLGRIKSRIDRKLPL